MRCIGEERRRRGKRRGMEQGEDVGEEKQEGEGEDWADEEVLRKKMERVEIEKGEEGI